MVAMSPDETCHSMWQWNSQIPFARLADITIFGDVRGHPFHTWVIGSETKNNVSIRIEHERVSTHRDGGEISLCDIGVLEGASFLFGAINSLEIVAVEMKRVTSRVEVVDDDLHDLTFLQNERVGVVTIHGGIVRCVTCCECCVESGNFWGCVGDVIEECTDTGQPS
jgi:hypothetical protein